MHYFDPQPIAGPSSRPHQSTVSSQIHLDKRQNTAVSSSSWMIRPARRFDRRQDGAGPTSSDSASSFTSSQAPLFVGPSASASSWQAYNASTAYMYNATYPTPVGANITPTSTSTSSRRTSTYSPTTTFTSLWTYSATRSSTATATSPSQSVYVPGSILNLTLATTTDTEAVYSVQMAFGHSTSDNQRRIRKRAGPSVGADWDGGDPQFVNMQIDLGSSDMWVAADTCISTACSSASNLFNTSQSLDSGSSANLAYASGAVGGDIYWEEVVLGDFGISYQAFVAADSVTDEDLTGGNFTGVLGLAMPDASTVYDTIGGTTGSSPDGATFLDNLFGSGSSAPSERLFSLSLARLEDVRTTSTFGIGAISSSYCSSPCTPTYTPIIAQPSLGTTGYTHWRVQLRSLTATTWDDAQHGTGATTKNITLGASQVYPSKASPVVVVDSGGVQILVGYRPYADAIYSAYGVSMSTDGYYRMPCTMQLALTFNIAGVSIPVHPLDMTYPDPTDESQSTCIGMIQYSSGLGDTGDFILGSSFMKNVYSIFQYPDVTKQTTWQPTVGFIPLTNASVASQDFYAVRSLHQSLATVSSSQQAAVGGTTTGNTGTTNPPASANTSKKVVSTALIAGVSVVGFFVVAAALFCAWWFWLRRKFGAAGVVEYKTAPTRPRAVGLTSDGSMSSSRNKKHSETLRQKSMIEGYSDYEGDSWMSTTEGNDSIRLGYLPEVVEDDETGWQTRADRRSRSSRGSPARASSASRDLTIGESSFNEKDRNSIPLVDFFDSTPTSTSAGAGAINARPPRSSQQQQQQQPLLFNEPEPYSPPGHLETYPLAIGAGGAGPYPYPGTGTSSVSTSTNKSAISQPSTSMSMSGPFPGPPTRASAQSTLSIATSPMYDIRTSDYFNVPISSNGTSAAGAGGGRGRRMSNDLLNNAERREGSGSAGTRRKSSPFKGEAGVDKPLKEEEE